MKFTSAKESSAGSGERYFHSEIQRFLINAYFEGLEKSENAEKFGDRVNVVLENEDLAKLTSHSLKDIQSQNYSYANTRRSLERRVTKEARNGGKRRAENFFKAGFKGNTADIEDCNKYPSHGEKNDSGIYEFTLVLIPAVSKDEIENRLEKLNEKINNEKSNRGEAK
ncbi:MAG: hypothetical protein ABEK17_03815 [Candidatus Aenigmatarchaeota archaeon]